MTTCTNFLSPASLKLTSKGYEFEGCQTSFKAVATQLESRQLPMGVVFKQRVLGHVVLGHTLLDDHGRWAMEFEVGRVWNEGDEESLTPYLTLKKTKSLNTNTRRKPKYIPLVAKPWWKFW